MLPFTRAEFLQVFSAYNEAIWPAQIVAYGLGIFAAALLLLRPGAAADRLIAAALASMWLWTGIGYHMLFFSGVNRLAPLFGGLFVLQGALLLVGGFSGWLRFRRGSGLRFWIAWTFVIYATAAYPLLGLILGHRYPEMPMFGVTPCPVTIFTLGFILTLQGPAKWPVLAIPLAWSLVGGSAAFLLDVPQDWLLLGSGLIAAALLARPDRTHPA